jgi:hypothetical protein
MADGTPPSNAGQRDRAPRRAWTAVGWHRWLALALLLSAPAAADNPDPEPVPLFTAIEPVVPIPPGYRQAWRIEFNHEQIREPAAAVRVSVPGLPEFVATLLRWSPREGYIDAPNPKHPTGLQQIPDPTAPPEAFSWHWYASNALSLTVHQGIVAGSVVRGARWFYISPRPGYTLLLEPSGSVGPPHVPPRPVPSAGYDTLTILALLIGLVGAACLWSRRLQPR